MDPTRVAALLCERPARHFGLYPRKGALIPSADADLAIVERRAWTFDESAMASEVKRSPYHGLKFGGRVVATYVRGTPVLEGGRVTGTPGQGEFIRPVG